VVRPNASSGYGELWIADVESGRSEPLFPGFPVVNRLSQSAFDISADGRQVLVESPDRDGRHRLWLAPIDRRSPPRQIPNVEGDGALFGPDGVVFFRGKEGSYGYLFRVRQDGTALRKVSNHPVIEPESISPDGRWIVAYARPSEEQTGVMLALPADGGPPIQIYGPARVKWSADGRFLFLSMSDGSMSSPAKTYAVAVKTDTALPDIPAAGFTSAAEIAALPGARVFDMVDIAPGPTLDVYAYSRETVHRNLYRVPVP
jgi:Tol biopolymer transport system component